MSIAEMLNLPWHDWLILGYGRNSSSAEETKIPFC